jgi:hypothetical protein
LIPTIMAHIPAGSSLKTFFHFCQVMKAGKLF